MFVNKEGQIISISDIPVSWLCPGCKALISEYCSAAKIVDKVEFDQASDEILDDIMRHTRKTKNPILRALYRDIKLKIRSVLNQPERENKVFLLLMHLANERAQLKPAAGA